MNISNYISNRYLYSPREYKFINIISLLSFIGITIGVSVIIIVLSIFNGFQELTKNQFINVEPHIQIKKKDSLFFLIDENLINKLKQFNEIKYIIPRLSFKSIISNSSNLSLIEIVSEIDTIFIDKSHSNSKLNLLKDKNNSVSIGVGLANNLKVNAGEYVNIIPFNNIENIINLSLNNPIYKLKINKIANYNINKYDYSIIIISYDKALEILNPDTYKVSQIDIYLKKIENLEEYKNILYSTFSENYKLSSWEELNPELFNIMKLEKLSTFCILSFILILSIFNILISNYMTVIEKQKDILILKSLGLNNKTLKSIFFNIAFKISLIGTLTGIFLSLLFYYLQSNYKILSLDVNKYVIDSIPIKIDIIEILIVSSFTILISSIISIYPAIKASDFYQNSILRSE
jgi:lipoprotein-releasing system permease protein